MSYPRPYNNQRPPNTTSYVPPPPPPPPGFTSSASQFNNNKTIQSTGAPPPPPPPGLSPASKQPYVSTTSSGNSVAQAAAKFGNVSTNNSNSKVQTNSSTISSSPVSTIKKESPTKPGFSTTTTNTTSTPPPPPPPPPGFTQGSSSSSFNNRGPLKPTTASTTTTTASSTTIPNNSNSSSAQYSPPTQRGSTASSSFNRPSNGPSPVAKTSTIPPPIPVKSEPILSPLTIPKKLDVKTTSSAVPMPANGHADTNQQDVRNSFSLQQQQRPSSLNSSVVGNGNGNNVRLSGLHSSVASSAHDGDNTNAPGFRNSTQSTSTTQDKRGSIASTAQRPKSMSISGKDRLAPSGNGIDNHKGATTRPINHNGDVTSVFAEGSFLFVMDENQAYIPAKSCKTFSQGEPGMISYLPLTGGLPQNEAKPRIVSISTDESRFALPMDDQSLSPISNMVELKQLNDASILHNLRMRFHRDEIYTQIGTILVSLNPFKLLPIYTPEIMEKYLRSGSRNNPPHVYGVADNAYRQMIERQLNQSCIVSGESGAGKTEATKLFLGYIAEASSQGDAETGVGTIQQQILEANPLMEAFGNAKTMRNDNSSRFGKWISITFNNKRGNIIGASITQYLLEKSRVVSHSSGERSYHIFYQLCAAAAMDQNVARHYKIKNPESYYYLNQNPHEVYTVNGTDDYKEWEHTLQAMNVIGIPPAKQDDVIRTVAGVLHLGNIRFEKVEVPGKDARAGIANMDTLQIVAEQLGSTIEQLTQALTKKNVSVGREVVFAEYSVEAACDARDALAKHLFGKTFEWLTDRINESLESGSNMASKSTPEQNKSIIGVLDIFGFESFGHNSFEQLCINYCNEKLQGFFNDHIFKLEQAEYEMEELDVSKIEFVDNQEVLDAIESKPHGILAHLDEELITPKGSDDGFLKKIVGGGNAPSRMSVVSRSSRNDNAAANIPSGAGGVAGSYECVKRPDIRYLRDNPDLAQCFIVVHYAGEVAYNVSGFLTKNKDSLIDDLEQVGLRSSIEFVTDLFYMVPSLDMGGGNDNSRGSVANRSASIVVGGGDSSRGSVATRSSMSKKGGKRSLGAQFKEQLASLMITLKSTEPHFVRCVKSNHEKKGNIFAAPMILDQLRYSGLMEVTRIRKLGYPVRKVYSEFVDRYAPLCPGFSRTGNVKELVHHLVSTGVLYGSDWQIGRTKVFMRQGMFMSLEVERDKALGFSVIVIQRVARGFISRLRYRNYQKILNNLKAAMTQNDESSLEAALLLIGELPHNGRHLQIVDEAKKLLDRLQAIRKVLELVQDAIRSKDLASLESATDAAIQLGIGHVSEVKEALQMIDRIRKDRIVRDALRAAMDKYNVTTSSSSHSVSIEALEQLEKAIAQAREYGLLDIPEAKVAISKRDRLVAIRDGVQALDNAINSGNDKEIERLVANLVNMGLENHPVVVKASKANKKSAKENAERARQIAHIERELHEATRTRDLNELNNLYPEIIRLGMSGPTVNAALALREQMTFEIDIFEKIDAEIKTIRVKADSYDGITRHDLAALSKNISMVKENGLSGHPKLVEAVEFQSRMVKHLVTQEQLKQALREKDPQGLKKAAEKATSLGMQTNLAKRVFAEVRQLQIQKTATGSRRRSIDTGVAPKLGTSKGKVSYGVSKIHQERLSKAQSEVFDFTKFFGIRSDEDFTQYEIPMNKKQKASKKLKFQNVSITRSILACNNELNQLAIRNHRSLLGWCGDSNSTFRATLAHDVLMRGLDTPEMTDEIYIQLCKHLVENPRRESIERAWLLFCMVTNTYAPSDSFAPYVLNFLLHHRHDQGIAGNFARLCIHQLDATISNKPLWMSPGLEDVQLYEVRPPVLATIHMVDGNAIDLPVSPDMTVGQAIEVIASAQNIAEADMANMGIFITPREFLSNEEYRRESRTGIAAASVSAAVSAAVQNLPADQFSASPDPQALGKDHSNQSDSAIVDSLVAAMSTRQSIVAGRPSAISEQEDENFGGSWRYLEPALPPPPPPPFSMDTASIMNPVVGPLRHSDEAQRDDNASEVMRTPPAPRTPWPLPGMVYLADIYVRLSSQGREPLLSFKRKLFFNPKYDSESDKLLYYQLVQDIVSGSLPVTDEAQVVALVALSMAAKLGKVPDDPNKLIEQDLMSFIPLRFYEMKTELSWARNVLSVADLLADMSASQLRERYIKTCKTNPLYGMTLFYGYRDSFEGDIIFGINYKGIHVVDLKTFAITASIPFKNIQKFEAMATNLKLTISHKKFVSVMHIYTLQAAEAFGLLHDYTHINETHAPKGHSRNASNSSISTVGTSTTANGRLSFLANAAASMTKGIARRLSLEKRT